MFIKLWWLFQAAGAGATEMCVGGERGEGGGAEESLGEGAKAKPDGEPDSEPGWEEGGSGELVESPQRAAG